MFRYTLCNFSNPAFGDIRTTEENGKPLFSANDVAKALGYVQYEKAIRTHCKGVSILDTPTNGGIQNVKFIQESDVYRLVMRSKLPQAEQFQDWVVEEVLPSIRKNGGYMAVRTGEMAKNMKVKPSLKIRMSCNGCA